MVDAPSAIHLTQATPWQLADPPRVQHQKPNAIYGLAHHGQMTAVRANLLMSVIGQTQDPFCQSTQHKKTAKRRFFIFLSGFLLYFYPTHVV